MTGQEEWAEDELKLPVAHSRPMAVLHDRSVMLTSPTSMSSSTRGTEAYTPSWGQPQMNSRNNSTGPQKFAIGETDSGSAAALVQSESVPIILEDPVGIFADAPVKSNNDEASVGGEGTGEEEEEEVESGMSASVSVSVDIKQLAV